MGRSKEYVNIRAVCIQRVGPTRGGGRQVKLADESMAIIVGSMNAHDQSAASFPGIDVLNRGSGFCGNGRDRKASGEGEDSPSGQKVLHILHNLIKLRKAIVPCLAICLEGPTAFTESNFCGLNAGILPA